jgi:hypothetical protein
MEKLRICKSCHKEFMGKRNQCEACRSAERPDRKVASKVESKVESLASENGVKTPKVASEKIVESAPVWRTVYSDHEHGGYWVIPGRCKHGVCLNPDCPNEGVKAVKVEGPGEGVPDPKISISDPTESDLVWWEFNKRMGSSWPNWVELQTNTCTACKPNHEFQTHLSMLRDCGARVTG